MYNYLIVSKKWALDRLKSYVQTMRLQIKYIYIYIGF